MSDKPGEKRVLIGDPVKGKPPQGEIQSSVFRNAGPADWTSDEDVADMARQGDVILHERGI